MDAVKSFNAELSALYEVKPPISKAKMTALTRGAIKAIKFYKHVVQSVEKFILKCKPEYKIPGLYVIDSIVRQSRHQFGADKDVFAPRFAKNMQQTFGNLFRCPPEDKSKVIRVLNLWQKNQVFAPDVIQPLFDLADPNHPIHREQSVVAQNNGLAQTMLNSLAKVSPALQKSPIKMMQQNMSHQGDAASTLANLGMANLANNPNILLGLQGQVLDPGMLVQLQTLHRLLVKQSEANNKPEGVHFDRKLLDFDYGSDEEEDPNVSPKVSNVNPAIDSLGSLLSNPEVLRQLQNLQQQISQQSQQSQQMEFEEKKRKLQEMKQQEEEFDKHLAQTVPNLPFAAECELKPSSHTNSPAIWSKHETAYMLSNVDMSQPPPGYKPYEQAQAMEEGNIESEVEFVDNGDVEVINLDNADSQSRSSHDDRYSSSRRRGRTRSRDRSRDRSGRDRRSRRSRSRSRSRRKRTRSREKEREKEREEREKERERRKRGLPPLKKDNLSVCSTTLWVGHLSKLVHQEDLSDTFGEFGDIVSIDLIPPRGCAFIVMHRRQDASRCLTKLKNHKMQGKAITLAWAPGKGVKGKDLKDYWEVDLGVSYIPWSKIRQDIDLELLEDGGMVDEDTMPQWMKIKVAQMQPKPVIVKQPIVEVENVPTFIPLPDGSAVGTPTTVDTSQPPPMHGGVGLLPPPPMAMPMVPPFPLNTRLLGPMGMSIPPGLMPNVPIGVPPPNALMSNQLLGMGSPFGQAPPGLLSQQLTQIPVPPSNNPDKMQDTGHDSIFGQALLPTPHDENMDVEMEDAEKSDKQLSLSEQLLASIGQFNGNATTQNLNAAVGRLTAATSSNHRPNPGGLGDGDDTRHSRDNRARDRDRDRGRDRDRSRRNSRDRNRDRDRRDDRDGNGNSRRDRNNRWGDRDRRDRDRDNEKRPERSEKTVNDRLREMANESVFNNENNNINNNNSNNRSDRHRDRHVEPTVSRFEPEVPPLLDRPVFPPPQFVANEPIVEREPEILDEILDEEEHFHHRDFEPVNNFDMRMRRHPVPMGGPDFDPRYDGVPEFDGPPMHHPDRIDRIEPDRFDYNMRRDPYDDMRIMDDFDPRMRGGPPGPPDFFPPPRDGFGPRPPMMRGPGPDLFPPRGPPMMGRPPGPHMFHPRAMRGPRPGPWMEGGGLPMRPPLFQPHPRFDGPSDFFNRGGGGPPPTFDSDSHPPRHRRHDDRRRHRQEENNLDAPDLPHAGGDRRSRWSNNSPREEMPAVVDDQPSEDCGNAIIPPGSENVEEDHEGTAADASIDDVVAEPTTPLHDEPQESKDVPQEEQINTEDAIPVEEEN